MRPNGRPADNQRIRVKWSGGGQSYGLTDRNGVYDTGVVNGDIDSIYWYDEKVHGFYKARTGELIEVTTPR